MFAALWRVQCVYPVGLWDGVGGHFNSRVESWRTSFQMLYESYVQALGPFVL